MWIPISHAAATAKSDSALADDVAHCREAVSNWVRVPRQHRLDPVPSYLREVGIIDASGTKVRDVAAAALMRPDVQSRKLPGSAPTRRGRSSAPATSGRPAS